MSGSKLDRANLRRRAQRVESYKTLITRQRTMRNNSPLKKLSSILGCLINGSTETVDATNCSRDIEDEQTNRDNHVSSPGSSTTVGSSDSSQDFQPNLCTSLEAFQMQAMPYQSEQEVSSVMTRSVTRKYASVGAINNRVDIDKEKESVPIKQWPTNVAYPIENPPNDFIELKDAVTRAFDSVLKFCKTAVGPEDRILQNDSINNNSWAENHFIDLSPYPNQEPALETESDESHITFHINENYTNHPFLNIITINEDKDLDGTLVIHDEEGEYETVTLHSGETYLVDNKCLSNSYSSGSNHSNTTTFNPNSSPDNPLIAINNDHTYAAKTSARTVIKNPESPTPVIDESEFKLENGLNDLLLNTAILKCLICNETPQEMMSSLATLQLNLFN